MDFKNRGKAEVFKHEDLRARSLISLENGGFAQASTKSMYKDNLNQRVKLVCWSLSVYCCYICLLVYR